MSNESCATVEHYRKMIQEKGPALSCGHWEFEPDIPTEFEVGDESMDLINRRSGGRLARGQRFFNLAEIYSRLHEPHSTLQQSWVHEVHFDLDLIGIDQRLRLESYVREISITQGRSHGSALHTLSPSQRPRERLSPLQQAIAEVHQRQPLEVYEDVISETSEAVDHNVADLGESCLYSPRRICIGEIESDVRPREPEQRLDRDGFANENWDPLGRGNAESPLPEWFPRKPLQDITNVLNAGLVDQPLQSQKKRKNPKVTLTPAPALVVFADAPIKNTKAKNLPSVSNQATKRASTLRKGFR